MEYERATGLEYPGIGLVYPGNIKVIAPPVVHIKHITKTAALMHRGRVTEAKLD
jgi:hypothetical protein